MYKTSAGQSVDLRNANEIAAGGEGKILEHPKFKDRVVKIYHSPRKPAFAKHLQLLAKLPAEFIKPIDIYYDSNNNVAGFDMDYVNLSDYWLFNNLFNNGKIFWRTFKCPVKVNYVKIFSALILPCFSDIHRVISKNRLCVLFTLC